MGGFYKPALDVDGDQRVRTKATYEGYRSRFPSISFETSKSGSLYHSDGTGYTYSSGSTLSGCSLNFYDNTGAAASVLSGGIYTDCTCTEIIYEPTFDYQIRGGRLISTGSLSGVTNDAAIFYTALPDIPENLGGSIDWFPGGFPLEFLKANADVDIEGYGAIDLFYDATLHTNKLRIRVMHAAGAVIQLLTIFKTFRP